MPARVSLFIGCLNDIYYPRVGVAVTKILEYFGCTVEFPEGQTCCGATVYQDGYAPQAKELARRFVGIFANAEYIVTPSPRCCGIVRDEYTRLLIDDPEWEQPMWQVAGRTYEFVEFLTTVLKADLSKLAMPKPAVLTYQPACMLRGLGVDDASPRILARIKHAEIRDLVDDARCCGAGGGLPAKQTEISDALRDQKIKAISETSANLTICNEALCAIRLGKGSVPIKHIAELLAETLGMDTEQF